MKSIELWDKRVIEREYWIDAYSYMSRFSHDPIYQSESFFDLPVVFLEQSLSSLQRVEKARVQSESISTAYLADNILSIVHSLYGKEGHPYKSNPAIFLPGYEPPTDENTEETLNPSPQTIKILLKLLKGQKLDGRITAHLAECIPSWAARHD